MKIHLVIPCISTNEPLGQKNGRYDSCFAAKVKYYERIRGQSSISELGMRNELSVNDESGGRKRELLNFPRAVD